MVFVPVIDVAQIELRGSLQSIPVENTWYAYKATGWDQTDLDTLTQEVSDAIDELWLTYQSPAFIWREVYARDLSSQDSFQSVNLDLAAVPGTDGGLPLPNNVSLAVARSSGLTGRSSRGRIFWMGLTTSYLTANENVVSGTYAGHVVAACEGIDLAIVAAGGASCVVSRFHNNAPRVTPVVYMVTDWSCRDLTVDTQRGRLA